MKTADLKFIILELFAVLLVFIVGFIGLVFEIPFTDLTANPISLLDLPFYQGILQRIGVILWGGTVLVTLFSFSILKSSENLKDIKKFLLYSGIFFGYFLMDELLLIHNFILPKVFNIHQLIVLIVYVILTVLFLLKFRNLIKKNNISLFAVAVTFLGLSVLVDILSYLNVVRFSFRYLLDDGLKFLGIANLFIYYLIYCRFALRKLTIKLF
ncbi:MAG: hypothetical protein IPJ03_00690 [Ignavibacteriales bacterium]|nr:hypothetical protein [Ignavibacteriales bacterium]